MARLLITGASGFIGQACLPLLAERFDEVHVISRREPPARTQLTNGIRWHIGDLLQSDVATFCEQIKATHLLHLAWIATPGEYWTSPLNAQWTAGSLRLLRALIRNGGQRFVGVGTCAEYDWSAGVCQELRTPLARNSAYAAAKNDFRQQAEEMAEDHQVEFAWARLFFVFGPGEPAAKLLPTVIRRLLDGLAVECTSGAQARDFIDVRNVAAALGKLIQHPIRGVVNVGSGQARQVQELVTQVADRIGRRELVQFTRPASTEPPLVEADITRLRVEAGFTPPIELDQSLHETIEWWRQRQSSGNHRSAL